MHRTRSQKLLGVGPKGGLNAAVRHHTRNQPLRGRAGLASPGQRRLSSVRHRPQGRGGSLARLARAMRRFTIIYFTPSGVKEQRISPYVEHAGAAVYWLLRQKPWLIRHLAEVEVRPYQKGDC